MDTYRARSALVGRCPGLSDGAKVTLIEYMQHFDNGRLPSLNEMKRLRNTARSTIQKHLQELMDYGVVRKQEGDNNRALYSICDKTLLKLNGLDSMKQIEIWVNSIEGAETAQPRLVRSMLVDPVNWNARDALAYFVILGKRKADKFKIRAEERGFASALMRRLLQNVGADALKLMIEHFSQNHTKMGFDFSILRFKQSLPTIMRYMDSRVTRKHTVRQHP